MYLPLWYITNEQFGYQSTRSEHKLHLMRVNTNSYRDLFYFSILSSSSSLLSDFIYFIT